MKLIFTEKSWDDYLYWQKSDKQIAKKINQLIKDIKRDPFNGIGKPEPLKHELSGFWSRRITNEHRLVYEVSENSIGIVSCRFHY
jgi:toxin YoeB